MHRSKLYTKTKKVNHNKCQTGNKGYAELARLLHSA